jgi:hypothetical protein
MLMLPGAPCIMNVTVSQEMNCNRNLNFDLVKVDNQHRGRGHSIVNDVASVV